MQTRAIPRRALDPARMLRTTFRGRCPECERGSVFAGVYRTRSHCPECGAWFERNTGNWTGPVVLGYVVGSLAAFAAGFLLWWRFGVFPGLEAAMIAIAFAAALLAYRPIKAWWLWLLWATGLVFPDDTADEASGSR